MRTKGLLLWTLVLIVVLSVACSSPTPTKVPAGSPPTPASATKPAGAAALPASPATPSPAGPTSAPAAKIKRGGILNYGSHLELTSMDPIQSINNDNMNELPIYESFLRWDIADTPNAKAELHGQLAESWEYTNPTTLVLKLQKGVKFHDGSDFNAEVAKWNFDRAKTHPKSQGKTFVQPISSMEVVDPYTVKLNLPVPSAIVLANLTHVAGGGGGTWSFQISKAAADKDGEGFYLTKAVGTGPMQLTEWKKDDRKILKKWDGYWRKGGDDQPLPYLDGINARIIPESAVMATEMRAGTVDISASLQPPDFATIKGNQDLIVKNFPWANKKMLLGFNHTKPPFANNVKLRQAAMWAIDREALAKVLGMDGGKANYYIFSDPGRAGYDESVPHYGFDLTKAKQLMAEAGHAQGVEAVYSVYSSPTARRREVEMIQAMWKDIKLNISIDVGEMAAIRQKTKSMDFQITGWGANSPLDTGHYSMYVNPDGATNWTGYNNNDVIKCWAEGNSLLDFIQRDTVFRRCQTLVYEDALIHGTYMIPFNVTYNKKVKGVRVQSFAMDLEEAWLDK